MMMQNINLLTTLPTPPKRYLMAETLLSVIAGWLFLLVLIYAVHFYLVSIQQTKLNKLTAIKRTMTQNIIALHKEVKTQEQGVKQPPTKGISPALAAFLAKQKTNKFSYYLAGLANTTPKGVWLKTMIFSNEDNDITLVGNTVSAELIPKFLRNLNKDKVFTGKKFSTLQLTKTEQENGEKFLAFQLATKTGSTS